MTAWLLVAALIGQYNQWQDGVKTPRIGLFQDEGTPWVAPGRLFSIKIPDGWGVALHDGDPYTYDVRAVGKRGDGILQIRRIKVPKGARPRQLMLNAIEQRLGKLPGFSVLSRRNVDIAGTRGAAVLASYAFQGNVQFPRIVEEVYVVAGPEAFILHFECFQPAATAFEEDLNLLYNSFQPRPPGASDRPFAVPDDGTGPNRLDTNKVPF